MQTIRSMDRDHVKLRAWHTAANNTLVNRLQWTAS